MKYVVLLPIVGVKESFNTAPWAFYGVRMKPNTLINETDRMVDGLVRIAVCIQMPVGCPEITDDRSALFDSTTNDCPEPE
jgi:hypothetical protein